MSTKLQWKGDEHDSIYSSTRYSDEYDRSSYDSTHSYGSSHTAYSVGKPTLQRHDTCLGRIETRESDYPLYADGNFDERRASIETYASTEAEEADLSDDESFAYDLVDFPDERYQSDAIPATPRDFSELFPSSRRLSIRHDDSTIDGNLNLRVDTQVETDWSSRKQDITLFHLKMNDLQTRDFSLRRYCRDSGREVCHSARKYHALPSERRPILNKSLSSALANFKKHSEVQSQHITHLPRPDSGYGSIFNERFDDLSVKSPKAAKTKSRLPTNTIKLEFSNYAQLEVKRRGTGSKKGYQFEYWGHNYTWRRNVRQEGHMEEVSFHLMRSDLQAPLAHIVPVPLSTGQAREESSRGGWVPPCSMWIKDQEIIGGMSDISDVVVASGLMALVDDSIKRKWHSSRHRQVLLPSLHMKYIGPKQVIDEVFNRRPTAHASAMQPARSD